MTLAEPYMGTHKFPSSEEYGLTSKIFGWRYQFFEQCEAKNRWSGIGDT